jgi:NADH:ubiquinone oxidoreductase subunit 6 (subunit J)
VEFYLTIAAVPVTIALLLLAAYWTRRESVPGMILIIIVYFAAMAYFMFKLVRMYNGGARIEDYLPARKMLTTFAVITILLLAVTITVAIMCTHNFNKGLKPHIAKRKVPSERDQGKQGGSYATEMPQYGFSNNPGQAGSRMTID